MSDQSEPEKFRDPKQPLNHERAAEAVLKKIEYAYQLTPSELKLNATDSEKADRANIAFMIDPQWNNTAQKALEVSGLPPTQLCDVKRLARPTMNALSNALHIRKSVKLKPEAQMRHAQRGFYADVGIRKQIVDAYISHLTNDLVDKLEAMGMKPFSARRVTGSSIRGAIGAYNALEHVNNDVIIRPEIKSTNGKTDEQLAEEQGRLRGYWLIQYREMNGRHKDVYPLLHRKEEVRSR